MDGQGPRRARHPPHTLEAGLAFLENRLSPSLLPEECATVSSFLAQGRAACFEPSPESPAEPSTGHLSIPHRNYLAAILDGNRQAALNVVDQALRDGHSHTDIYIDVFGAALYRIGRLWELNQVSVAQEHIATSITQYAIAAIYPRMVPAAVHRGTMVVTGVSGELHQIGANLVADAMEANGWVVRFLGTDLPHSSILSAVEEISAGVLCISTTIVANLPAVSALLQFVRAELQGRAPKVFLGGGAYRLAPQFAKEVGAEAAFTDLRQALAILCPPHNP